MLDDYVLQVRLGHRFGFDFMHSSEIKLDALRQFNKRCKDSVKQNQEQNLDRVVEQVAEEEFQSDQVSMKAISSPKTTNTHDTSSPQSIDEQQLKQIKDLLLLSLNQENKVQQPQVINKDKTDAIGKLIDMISQKDEIIRNREEEIKMLKEENLLLKTQITEF